MQCDVNIVNFWLSTCNFVLNLASNKVDYLQSGKLNKDTSISHNHIASCSLSILS